MADRSIFSSVKAAAYKSVVRRQAVRIGGTSLLLMAVAGMVIWASGHWATHAAVVTTLDLANTADLGLTMQDEQGKGEGGVHQSEGGGEDQVFRSQTRC